MPGSWRAYAQLLSCNCRQGRPTPHVGGGLLGQNHWTELPEANDCDLYCQYYQGQHYRAQQNSYPVYDERIRTATAGQRTTPGPLAPLQG